MVRCSQFGSQVWLQFSLTLSLFVSRSGLQDVTDRFCLAGAKRWSVTIKLWIRVGTINIIFMSVFAWLFSFEYYIHYTSVQETLGWLVQNY